MQASRCIEDYGFIGNLKTAALIDRDACIAWLCLPRFDAEACCALLLGEQHNGYWQISPPDPVVSRSRHYRGETLVLETEFEIASGRVAVIDFMPPVQKGQTHNDLVRVVEGRQGHVEMQSRALFRFDYGRVAPFSHYQDGVMSAVAGPDSLRLVSEAALEENEEGVCCARFNVASGERVAFVLTWHLAWQTPPEVLDADLEQQAVEQWWQQWSSRCEIDDRYRAPVIRSLITLKALTDADTGGILGAATTSLPEISGGEANWDYRYTWLRDASFVLHALLDSGYREEAEAWRSWLLRAVAGGPESLQPMYGIGGERRLVEHELPWLAGFNGATPVRIGNGAWQQQQLDVYGEVMDALHRARRHALAPESDLWHVQYQLLEYLEQHWQEPGAGLWELRGPQRHYTHSRVMVWVAFDRAVKAVECFDMKGDLERWKALRQQVHDEVCAQGFNTRRQSFVQYYGGDALDVSALLLPLMGFLPADDPRMVSTVDLIRKELGYDDFLYRFLTDKKQACLTDGEGAFVIGCFWLVDNLVLQERHDEAQALFDRLLGIRNDLGLMSEEYDPRCRRQLGNVPQAFSHVGLINSAHLLARGACSSKGYP